MTAFGSRMIWSACCIRAGALFGVEVAGGGSNGWITEGALPEGEVEGVPEEEVDEGFTVELELSAGQIQVLVELLNVGTVVPWGSQNCPAQGATQPQVAFTCSLANMPL